MNKFDVIYKKEALKFLKKNKTIGKKFAIAFEIIASSALTENSYDIKKLNYKNNYYRLRIGSYRAIFEINNEILVIYVIDIDSRGDIYKKLK